MYCSHSRLGSTLVVELRGRLDADTADTLETHCHQALVKTDRTLVLDLAHLEYLSSAGLRAILTLAKQLKGQGATIALSNATGVVREVLEVSGFSAIFRFVDAPDAAPSQSI